MRENIGVFRGKRVDTGQWKEGYLLGLQDKINGKDLFFIVDEMGEYHRVDPETVGEFTGVTDKDGTGIFEGDILQGDEYPYCSDGNYSYYAEVVWFDDGCCGFGLCTHKNPKSTVRGISDGNCEWFEDFDSNNWSVVGNIYDNPELIEEGSDENEHRKETDTP